MSQQTVFHAPPPRVIENYALAVCQQLEQTGEIAYRQPDVLRGFITFMQTVVAISVEYRNHQPAIHDGCSNVEPIEHDT